MTAVKVHYHGEHHMSAATIEMELPFSIKGSARLFSTNGKVAGSKNDTIEYLYDANVVLKLNLKTKKVAYMLSPKGKFISEFLEQEDGFKMVVYDNHSKSETCFLSRKEATFKSGFGPVKNGMFPSAYMSHVNQIKSR